MSGIGKQNVHALGSSKVDTNKDNISFSIKLHIVANDIMKMALIIGYNILQNATIPIGRVEVKVMNGARQSEHAKGEKLENDVHQLFKIELDGFKLDLHHIRVKK